MDELEQRLQAARLAEPSPELDRRIAAAFRATPPAARPARGIWWWLGIGAAAGSLAAGWLVVAMRQPPPAPHAVVFHIEAGGRMRDLLLNTAANQDAAPDFELQVEAH